MDEVRLILKAGLKNIPVEAETIRPDIFTGKSHEEIEALPLYQGNREVPLGELFEVRGERASRIRLSGDLSHVKKIGWGMKDGRIIIQGNVGMHLGADMRGGEILVEGDASDWLGGEMKGGLIRVKGNVGNFAGAAYPGSTRGMRNGIIIIEGNAGNQAGERMRRGLMVVTGESSDFTGSNMIAGTILLFGKAGRGTGVSMKRGTIVCFKDGGELFPTFRYNCTCSPLFLKIYLKRLKNYGINIKKEYLSGAYRRYNGDITELGKGEILLYERV